MKLLPSTQANHVSGVITTERVIRKTDTKNVLTHETNTEGLGPFSRDAVHGRVGARVSATISRDYHSVSISVHVEIPVHASPQGVDEGLSWSFQRAGQELNSQLKGARKALKRLTDPDD